LMEGTLADIKKACKYQIIRPPLVPTVYKLASNKYLLSNITKAKMTCNKTIHLETAEKDIVLQNTRNIIHVDCGCFVQADQFVLIDSSFDCRQELDLNTTGRAFFILNLPYISEFLDDSSLDVLPGDFFLNTSILVILPTLAVASKNYEHMLAESEEDSYELTKVVNATKRHVCSGFSTAWLTICIMCCYNHINTTTALTF